MYINHKQKAIFLHNLKCGGNYVIHKLLKYYEFEEITQNIHKNYEDFFDNNAKIKSDEDLDSHTIRKFGKYRYYFSHQDVDKLVFNNYMVFTFVRNPYDKIYSAYNYLKYKLKLSPDKKKIRNSTENPEYFSDFKTFIKNMNNVNNISYCHAFIPQYEHLINYSNEIKIQYIGKTETLDDDFVNILKIMGIEEIKHINEIFYEKKQNCNINIFDNISNEIDEETLKFINERFKVDFEAFGYKLYESIDDLKENYFKKNNNLKLEKTINADLEECNDFIINNNFYNINVIKTNLKLIEKILDEKDNFIKTYEKIIEDLCLINRKTESIKDSYITIRKKQETIYDKTYLTIEKIIKNIPIENKYECENCNFISNSSYSNKVHSFFCKQH